MCTIAVAQRLGLARPVYGFSGYLPLWIAPYAAHHFEELILMPWTPEHSQSRYTSREVLSAGIQSHRHNVLPYNALAVALTFITDSVINSRLWHMWTFSGQHDSSGPWRTFTCFCMRSPFELGITWRLNTRTQFTPAGCSCFLVLYDSSNSVNWPASASELMFVFACFHICGQRGIINPLGRGPTRCDFVPCWNIGTAPRYFFFLSPLLISLLNVRIVVSHLLFAACRYPG